jgi:hypothetical protein
VLLSSVCLGSPKKRPNFQERRQHEVRGSPRGQNLKTVLGVPSYEPDPNASVPYGCSREWHRNGEFLRSQQARRICTSVKDYAAGVASGIKRK